MELCCPARSDAPHNVGQQAAIFFAGEAAKAVASLRDAHDKHSETHDKFKALEEVVSKDHLDLARASVAVRTALNLANDAVCPVCGLTAHIDAQSLWKNCMAMHCDSPTCSMNVACGGYCFFCRKIYDKPKTQLDGQDDLHHHVTNCSKHPYRCDLLGIGRGVAPCPTQLRCLHPRSS